MTGFCAAFICRHYLFLPCILFLDGNQNVLWSSLSPEKKKFNRLPRFFLVEDNSLSQKKKVTLEDLFSDEFKVHDPEAKWISGECRVPGAVRNPFPAPHHLLIAWLSWFASQVSPGLRQWVHRALAVIIILLSF